MEIPIHVMKAPAKPVLSVITVVYNNAADIERTIRSVVGQTYPGIEYLIINGFASP